LLTIWLDFSGIGHKLVFLYTKLRAVGRSGGEVRMATPVRASERSYEALRNDIVEWKLGPGTVLGEVEQAARLGVSRTPLREAL
jgi:hypothetical protein